MVPLSRRTLLLLFLTGVFFPTPAAADERPAANPQVSDYELMKLFVETFQQVDSRYVRDVDKRELMEAAIQGMLQHLDQYSSFIPPEGVRRFNQLVEQEFGGIGITVNVRGGRLVVISPLPDSPAWKGGIRAGDVIEEVDGVATKGAVLNDVIEKLQGPVGRPVRVTISRPGANRERSEVDLVRQLIKAPTIRGDRYNGDAKWVFTLPEEPQIGYVRISHFSRFTAQELRDTVRGLVEDGMEGLILDLRFNPGGLLESAVEIADMFLESGNIVSVRGRSVPDKSWDARQPGTFPQFPMAVIVNRYSASASEVLSASLQDNQRAIVVGERTWGKGSVQNVIPMEGGSSALKLTTASYHRPSGVNIHRFRGMTEDVEWGVMPDDGFLIPYNSAEWTAWDQYRSARDVLRDREEQKPEAQSPQEADRQLAAAIRHVLKQIEDSGAAEGVSEQECCR